MAERVTKVKPVERVTLITKTVSRVTIVKVNK